MHRLLLAPLMLSAALVFTPAARAETPKPIEKVENREPASDRDFLIWAINCELSELQLADRAIKNASSDKVRELAREMKTKHTAHRDALLDEAKKRKIGVVAGLDKHHREIADRLSKLEGKEFDTAYVNYLVEGHEKGIEMYQKWQKKTEDANLKKVAEEIQPTLRNHLEKARTMKKDLSR